VFCKRTTIITMQLNSFIEVLDDSERSITVKHWRKKRIMMIMMIFMYLCAYSTAQSSITKKAQAKKETKIYTHKDKTMQLLSFRQQ
jgi:hypothetical protein